MGGAERAVYQLVREQLRDPELKPAVLFAQGGGVYETRMRALACEVIALDLPHGHALSHFGKIVETMRPFDIHHFHAGELLLFLASLRCVQARRVYTHRAGLIDYPLKKRVLHGILAILLRCFFQGFSGNTRYGARCGAKLYHIPEESFKVTYNALSTDLMQPMRPPEVVYAELGLRSSLYILGTAANLKAWKRIDRLLYAVAALADPNLVLLIVGDGIERERLEALTDKLRLRSQIIFAGRQVHVADYLQIMNAFCLPSMGLESFGNAAVEAMAMGLPTIVFSDGGGLVEHIQPESSGFIVANQFQLLETLVRLRANPALGRRIGQRARASVLCRYTPGKVAAAFKSIYTEIWRE